MAVSEQSSIEDLARLEFETSLILEAIDTEDRAEAIRNLRFFVEAGFISDVEGKISSLNDEQLPSQVAKLDQPLIDDRQVMEIGTLADPVSIEEASKSNFEVWVEQFFEKATRDGISESTIRLISPYFTIDRDVLVMERNQVEFSLQATNYILNSTSAEIVSIGVEKRDELRELLDEIESDYLVSRDILLALWGHETRFGSLQPRFNVVTALATLAYDGRRRTFAERQLLDVLRLISEDELDPGELEGSWGGALGQMQFTPQAHLKYGIDFDGDGRRDPNSSTDALASTANYMSEFGWNDAIPWGYRVVSNGELSEDIAGQYLPFSKIDKIGLGIENSDKTSPEIELAIIKIGESDPAYFAVTRNFDVLRHYNNSISYALTIGLLADLIGGSRNLPLDWLSVDG
ncbi:lytic transglycosylase domain-containing protein [Nereida sp. MMG025]|uniref:lytic murein transglycosylase n=1 Tax=Nereida sp. MMG025 TaxID=2909981 RepID=UPI001F464974|nr:lytic murein transglycosylase [Nereida sp. MMG025]MCF6446083.1 lytic murein transglycosylase [Nereida sp. MMG025]